MSYPFAESIVRYGRGVGSCFGGETRNGSSASIVTIQGEILLLLDELVTQRGMALLFISHDLAVIAQVVSRVIVMQSGHIVEDAPLDSIVSSPQHHCTRSFLHSARILDSALGDIR